MASSFGDSWKEAWDAREAALVSVLGPTNGMVLHAVKPFAFGGPADVLCFDTHIPGRVAATCELLDEPRQVKNSLGNYELVMAHRDDNMWGPNFIARLAPYTCEAQLEPGHTMDITSLPPEGSAITALLFETYAQFEFAGRDAGLLLCIGITDRELQLCRGKQREKVMAALKAKGVYPYTDLFRESVI